LSAGEPVVAVDAMGGDHAPLELVEGSLLALSRDPGLNLTLVGQEPELAAVLAGRSLPRLQLAPSEGAIPMDAHPAQAVRAQPRSSVGVGVALVHDGQADALFTAGHSGAAMAASLVGLGRLPGISRPAIATPLPGPQGVTWLVDAGAQVDCKPEWLAQFAQLGCRYVELAEGKPRPRIGLLSNGTEPTKGNQVVQEAHRLLSELELNYVGPVEGTQLLSGELDIVVCDGLVGNVALKTAEGVAEQVVGALRAELSRGPLARLGALLLLPGLGRMRRRLDWRAVGGAPLLGVRGLVYIGHGRSDRAAVAAAVAAAARAVRSGALAGMTGLRRAEPAPLGS
jgi:glycerol-3-phosphate acyltransferase PlsX